MAAEYPGQSCILSQVQTGRLGQIHTSGQAIPFSDPLKTASRLCLGPCEKLLLGGRKQAIPCLWLCSGSGDLRISLCIRPARLPNLQANEGGKLATRNDLPNDAP